MLQVCVFIASFRWGWGPLGWLVPSKIQPLNTRSAGQSITTFVQLTSGATVGQTFLSMLCSMKYGKQDVLCIMEKDLLCFGCTCISADSQAANDSFIIIGLE
jgi:hypothetical protein